STQQGRTVLFVSHNMAAVSVLCRQATYLEKGAVTYYGDAAGAIQRYAASFARREQTATDPRRRSGTGELRFTAVYPSKESFECGEEKVIHFEIRRYRQFEGKFFVAALVVNEIGADILHCDSRLVTDWFPVGECCKGRLTILTPWLKPGEYRIDLFICSNGVLDAYEDACRISVAPLLPYPGTASSEAWARGAVFGDYAFTVVPAADLTSAERP
ncbi:MAG: hypothetical protein WHZ52_13590, partial [Armatimonadota bacterium]